MRGITKKQFALQQGVSSARVSQWIKSKIISTLPDGSIDPIEGERDLLKNRDASKRIDWEYRIQPQKQNHPGHSDPGPDGPPPPFTGNVFRDALLMGFPVFYKFYGDTMAPIFLKLLTEFCHVAKEEAEELTILFIFKTHEVIQEFLKKDIFEKWLNENLGEDVDNLQSFLTRGPFKSTVPPRSLPIMEHPAFILELLKRRGREK